MNQKPLLIVYSVIISLHGFAQLTKNKWMLNGKAHYSDHQTSFHTDEMNSNLSNREISTTDGNMQLNFGHFLTKNFALGATGSFGKVVYKTADQYLNQDHASNRIRYMDYSSGMFARYNHLFKDSKFGLFIQLDNRLLWGNQVSNFTYESPFSPTKEFLFRYSHVGYAANLSPGILYFIGDIMSIEANLGEVSYVTAVYKDKIKNSKVNKTSDFNSDFSTSTLYLGITFYLGKSESTKTSP